MVRATTVYGLPEHIDRLPIAAITVLKPQSALDDVVSPGRHTYMGCGCQLEASAKGLHGGYHL